jgi:carboxylesterase type B
MDADDHEFAKKMGAYWVQFARSGDPNCTPHLTWPVFTSENQVQMEFGEQIGVTPVERAARYDLHDRRRMRQIEMLKKLKL